MGASVGVGVGVEVSVGIGVAVGAPAQAPMSTTSRRLHAQRDSNGRVANWTPYADGPCGPGFSATDASS